MKKILSAQANVCEQKKGTKNRPSQSAVITSVISLIFFFFVVVVVFAHVLVSRFLMMFARGSLALENFDASCGLRLHSRF